MTSIRQGTQKSLISLISPTAAPMLSEIGTESVTESVIVIAKATAATSATAEIERVIATSESAGMTATAVQEGLILSMGPAAAEDDEPSNQRIGVDPERAAPSVGLKSFCREGVRDWWTQPLGVGS